MTVFRTSLADGSKGHHFTCVLVGFQFLSFGDFPTLKYFVSCVAWNEYKLEKKKRKEINWWWWCRYPSIWREKWSKNFSWRFLKRQQGRCRNGLIAGVLVIAGNTDITAVYISRRLVNAGNFPRHRYPPLLLKTPGKTPIMLFAVFFLELLLPFMKRCEFSDFL